jgi:cbb3-type cytochrome oxidase maturation protein
MSIVYVLIPLGLVLVGVGLWAFFWAVGNGQFDDLDSPGGQCRTTSARTSHDTHPPLARVARRWSLDRRAVAAPACGGIAGATCSDGSTAASSRHRLATSGHELRDRAIAGFLGSTLLKR